MNKREKFDFLKKYFLSEVQKFNGDIYPIVNSIYNTKYLDMLYKGALITDKSNLTLFLYETINNDYVIYEVVIKDSKPIEINLYINDRGQKYLYLVIDKSERVKVGSFNRLAHGVGKIIRAKAKTREDMYFDIVNKCLAK